MAASNPVEESLLGIPDLVRVLNIIAWNKCFDPPTFSSGEHWFTKHERILARGSAVIHASGDVQIEAWDNAIVYLSGNAFCIAHDQVKIVAVDNSHGELYDQAKAKIKDSAEFWCYDRSKVSSRYGYLHLFDNSHGVISHSTVDAWDDSTISLLTHSTIHASGHVVITQGPFVDTSDVVCDQDAKLIGAPRLGDGMKKKFFTSLPK